jgi:hypothetical protein
MIRFRLGAVVTVVAFICSLGAAAFAQAVPSNVRGQVVSLDGNVLTVKTRDATVKVALTDNYRVQWVVKSDISKIGPGTFIGTAAIPQPDGTYRALEIQLFDQVNHPPEADRPFDLQPASTMTNAAISELTATTVGTIQGHMMILKLKDGEKKVFVPASAPVVSFAPADKTAIVPGANVVLFASKLPDGSYTAGNVSVGKDGLVPPF